MKALALLAFVLVLVGAVNWGLVGLAQFDLVAFLFGGQSSALSRVVYSLVGAAAVTLLILWASGAVAVHEGAGGDRGLSRASR